MKLLFAWGLFWMWCWFMTAQFMWTGEYNDFNGGASVALNDEFAKRLVTAAAVTLLYEGMLGHILEFLKIAMQTAEPGTTYMSIISSITSEKGIGGLWDGFIPWGVIQSIFKGGVVSSIFPRFFYFETLAAILMIAHVD